VVSIPKGYANYIRINVCIFAPANVFPHVFLARWNPSAHRFRLAVRRSWLVIRGWLYFPARIRRDAQKPKVKSLPACHLLLASHDLLGSMTAPTKKTHKRHHPAGATENNVHDQFLKPGGYTFVNVNTISVMHRNLLYYLKLIFLHTIKLQV
jgi:hypothetical protein